MFAWLRHKLFGTEFVRLKFGWHFYLTRVRYTLDKKPYVIFCDYLIAIDFKDSFDGYEKWVWVYKNPDRQQP